MEHSFNIEIAEKVGVNAAIILKNLTYWCLKNKANEKHFYDGNWWTYNSVKAFKELFPYMSADQIRGALKKLQEHGYIEVGNYNKVGYDRTKWFSVKSLHSICEKSQIDLSKTQNRFMGIPEPIPNINTDINTDNKLLKKSKNSEIIANTFVQNIQAGMDSNVALLQALESYDTNDFKQKALLEKTLSTLLKEYQEQEMYERIQAKIDAKTRN